MYPNTYRRDSTSGGQGWVKKPTIDPLAWAPVNVREVMFWLGHNLSTIFV